MTTDNFLELKSFKVHKGNALMPNQIETAEWLEQLKHNDTIYFKHIESRDLGMHKAYFKILSYIYDRLPLNFKNSVAKQHFYKFLKLLSKEYTVVFKFKDGREMIEYNSISFSKMNQTKFREYFNNQLSVIYEELLIPFEIDYLMDEVQEEFDKILLKLI